MGLQALSRPRYASTKRGEEEGLEAHSRPRYLLTREEGGLEASRPLLSSSSLRIVGKEASRPPPPLFSFFPS